ncbi:MAG: response regulator transcription factor [Firmicutes bacterium]|nr:response regulator transcription factor [Bacillota bacterium]
MGQLILVVEDEKPIAEIVKYNLENEGYKVELAFDGREALEKVFRIQPDLILLDIMLPKINGLEVCKHIRSSLNTPILMVTAKATESDKVNGLELGADDYITKPFSPRELIARVKAALRRANDFSQEKQQSSSLQVLDLEIDFAKYCVIKRGEPIDLTVREYELLKYLALSPGTVFDREHLLKEVWGYDYFGHVRTVDVTVRRLREKIEDDPSQPKYILMRRGVGYYFREI